MSDAMTGARKINPEGTSACMHVSSAGIAGSVAQMQAGAYGRPSLQLVTRKSLFLEWAYSTSASHVQCFDCLRIHLKGSHYEFQRIVRPQKPLGVDRRSSLSNLIYLRDLTVGNAINPNPTAGHYTMTDQ
jgi:hypothetical protein